MKRRGSDQPAQGTPEAPGAQGWDRDSRQPTDAGWRSGKPPADAPVDDGLRRIGDYEVVEPLGQGGMGQVFRARQHQPVERDVAVKILRAAASPSSALAVRFEAEQQSLALVAHPNVAQIFDAGVTDEGLPFLVMEYLPGKNICEFARDGELGVRARLRLFLPVCEAVQHAHRRGVIHRDLKPSNVLVLETGGKSIPKVIDFGLAKLMHDGPDLTRADALLGTPGYMSPEQIYGDSNGIDTRTDVYGLGAVLYELLAGEAPFDISRDNIARLFETVSARTPERPSRRAPSERASLLADDLDWVVLKALAKDPDERYGSVDALAADLTAVLDGRPVSARRPTLGYKLLKWSQRHRAAVVMGALAVAVTVGAIAWGAHSRWQSAQQTRLAQQLGEEVARFESRLRFAHTIPLHDLRPTKAQIRTRVDHLASELETADAASEGPLSYAVGRGWLALGESSQARDVLERAWQSGYETPETALALGEAMSLQYRRERESALAIRNERQRQARLTHLDEAYRRPIVDWLSKGSQSSSGSAHLATARLAFYEERFDETLDAVARSTEEQPWLYEALALRAEVHRRRASDARHRGEFELALAAIDEARVAYVEAARLGESDPGVLIGECQLAIDMVLNDRVGTVPVEDLESVVEHGLGACRRAIEADPELSASWAKMAELHRQWGFNIVRKRRPLDPLPVLGAAVTSAERALELDESDAEAWLQLGRTQRELYRIGAGGERAFEHLDRAVEALEQAHELAPERAPIASGMATVYSDLARRASGLFMVINI